MIHKDSKIKDVLENPIGRDVLVKILMQLGYSLKVVDNPFIRQLRIKDLQTFLGKKLGDDFFETLYTLLNQEQVLVPKLDTDIVPKWWKEAIFYQIYPRSFKDSNGDGYGDLQGIISKLDYLKDLGIDALWLSPIYESPLDDNGYDISNYRDILNDFGTMEDFEELIQELRKRDMKIIMDLVVNHTSDEHPWFKDALTDKDSPYRDYYYFSDKPNNWVSFFSGSAWKQVDEKEYVLSLFSDKQIDLNWHNPAVRKEVDDIVSFWKDKGIDGFRLDVINYIAKNSLEDGNEVIGELMEFYGIEHYYFGEKLREYLHELRHGAMDDLFMVGETPGVGFEMSRLLTHEPYEIMDTVFMFDHLETPGHVRFDDYQYDLRFIKEYYLGLYERYGNGEWPSLFFDNHDNPRMISKVTLDLKWRKRLGKLLGTLLLTLKGTPFIYQGTELGMVNQKFNDIADYRDVESLNKYNELKDKGVDEPEIMKTLLAGSRDHARVVMPWAEGFSSGEPWIDSLSPIDITDETEMADPDSIYHWYKELIQFRKDHKVLIYGDLKFIKPNKKNVLVYTRSDETETFLIVMNLGQKHQPQPLDTTGYQLIFSNMKYHLDKLSAYEVNIYRQK